MKGIDLEMMKLASWLYLHLLLFQVLRLADRFAAPENNVSVFDLIVLIAYLMLPAIMLLIRMQTLSSKIRLNLILQKSIDAVRYQKKALMK